MILASDAARSLAGPFVAACALLVVAGASKILRPAPTLVAARAAGLRVPRFGLVAFGLLECGAGVAGVLVGGRAALVVGACYLLLTVVAIRLLVRAPETPCACLGSASAVVARTHVVINVVAASVAVVAASGASPVAQLRGRWIAGSVFAVLVACCVKLAVLALEALPEVAAAAKEGTT